ncbi:MAG TPA: NAD(P)-binding domain-containing protein [Jatrophihabitans sp.]|nr:NAD(P)-binding domain-containing protein [Jatrophihabitans sp.]
MSSTDTVVIGAGHAGLAVSRLLTAAGRDHVVLERGRVAQRWRTERWDSLRLLSPNWMTRLPGMTYQGPEPDGFMPAGRFVEHLERYAAAFAAPVLGSTTVLAVGAATAGGYRLVTDRDEWRAANVVIATGPHGVPRLPAGLDATEVVTADRYRNPAQLPSGGVLVIGASSSGVQIADELNRAGREVVLAVGRHTRIPRRYRGMDIFWWLERTGRLARTIDDVDDPVAARREPSMQLIGRRARPEDTGDRTSDSVDLVTLHAHGVRLTGRFDGMDRGRARFRCDLADTTSAADTAMHRTLDAIDDHIAAAGLGDEVLAARRPPRLCAPTPVREIDLASAGIHTVLVAAGYRPHYPWLRLPITDRSGAIRQYRGVTPAPGLYIVGQRFQHRRDSGFIDGARRDAWAVVQHLTTGLRPDADAERDEEPAA